MTDDQSSVIEFLSQPSTHGGATVERIETHASIVFLTDARALKLKRAVRYDYLDFSTVDRRKAMCEAELRINRRAAPDLYRRVTAVTRGSDGALTLGGSGQAVDWLVEMRRFDQEGLLDRLASRQALPVALMEALASEIARFHQGAEPRVRACEPRSTTRSRRRYSRRTSRCLAAVRCPRPARDRSPVPSRRKAPHRRNR